MSLVFNFFMPLLPGHPVGQPGLRMERQRPRWCAQFVFNQRIVSQPYSGKSTFFSPIYEMYFSFHHLRHLCGRHLVYANWQEAVYRFVSNIEFFERQSITDKKGLLSIYFFRLRCILLFGKRSLLW